VDVEVGPVGRSLMKWVGEIVLPVLFPMPNDWVYHRVGQGSGWPPAC
jgi:hypothetical protein